MVLSLNDGISHLSFNNLSPPVQIEQITAERKTFNANRILGLPPLIRDLKIKYTVLGLVAPETIKFRYKLQGEIDWQDTDRRPAFYRNLSRRDYRFRVMASNKSDAWNRAAAAFEFSVALPYYHARWFQAACEGAFLLLLWLLYQLRFRKIAREFNVDKEACVNERARIARELHAFRDAQAHRIEPEITYGERLLRLRIRDDG